MRRRPWPTRLALGLAVALLLLLGVEAALRLLLPAVRTATLPEGMIRSHLETPGFRPDPDLYWYWARLPSPAMQINGQGFRRTTEVGERPPPGVRRVITFGDSQTVGAGVGPDETYSAFAERALGPGWEVLNAGISGYRSLNVYRLLRLRMGGFHPDVVLIDCMPYDSPRDDGRLVGAPEGSALWRGRSLLWESRIYWLLRLGVEKADPERARWLDRVPTRGDALGLGNHDLIADWGRAHGVKVVFMQYPVSTDAWQLGCQTLPGELPAGVPVVRACDVLQASGLPASALFQDRNHLTVLGSRLVGEAVAATLRELD